MDLGQRVENRLIRRIRVPKYTRCWHGTARPPSVKRNGFAAIRRHDKGKAMNDDKLKNFAAAVYRDLIRFGMTEDEAATAVRNNANRIAVGHVLETPGQTARAIVRNQAKENTDE